MLATEQNPKGTSTLVPSAKDCSFGCHGVGARDSIVAREAQPRSLPKDKGSFHLVLARIYR